MRRLPRNRNPQLISRHRGIPNNSTMPTNRGLLETRMETGNSFRVQRNAPDTRVTLPKNLCTNTIHSCSPRIESAEPAVSP
ncbi:hypothetical protein NOCARDAX2BIS_80050 [Nocardioides sp. AX2bis]|nr:hypothetical protein NOCARDAX2BIS_80050 [Nocardioides sp. AX2bis]